MNKLKNISDKNRKILYSILLIIGLAGIAIPLTLIRFGIDWDAMINNEVVALIMCVVSIGMIVGSCIGLCRRSDRFKKILVDILECL